MAAQSTLRTNATDKDPFLVLYTHYLDILRSRLKRSSKTARLVATLTLTLSILTAGYGGHRWWRLRKAEKERGKKLLRRNSGLKGKDGSRTVFVPYKSSTSRVTIHPTKLTTFDAHRRLFLQPPRAAGLSDGQTPQVPPPSTKPGLNLAFLHQFLSLLSIMIPRWGCKETGLLVSHGVFLLLRTYLSLVVARLDGEIVRDLVAGNGRAFLWGICKWCGIGSLASYTNAMIKFLQSKVSIAFRTRLTRYIHDLYLSDNLTYHKLHNLDGGVGQGADQFITQDLTVFCESAASLYSSIGKPLVDLCVFNFQLFRSLGPLALSGLLANYFLTATILRRLAPPFGKLKAVEGRREGDFRGLHARLIANAEEVAFYGGEGMERTFLDKGFRELKGWVEGIYSLKIRYNMLEDFILKYSWSAFGYLITSLPVYLPAWGGLAAAMADARADSGKEASPSRTTATGAGGGSGGNNRERNRMKDFITNKRLMLSLADAGGRMMYSLKDLAELAGSTSRVYTLISTLHRVHAAAYFDDSGARGGGGDFPSEPYSLSDVQGTVHKGFDGIRLEGVPIVAPSLWPMGGEELLASLSFIVRPGEHLLVTGANGVGKSAISRVIAGLWPAYRGLVSRPRFTGTDGIMFIPQRPYLSTGTLRDQVIYPDTAAEMREQGRRDIELRSALEDARLGYLPDREGGWDTRKEWKDVLSGGEKQRMGIARLFWQGPRFAVLDEATSAVSADVEGVLYECCKSRGITLITISTRASLKRHHSYSLTLGPVAPTLPSTPIPSDGPSPRSPQISPRTPDDAPPREREEITYSLQRIGTAQEKQSVANELAELTARMERVEGWRRRRGEVEKELRLGGEAPWVKGAGVLETPEYMREDGDSGVGADVEARGDEVEAR